jgi:peptidoglycan/LPS O-acetylase OafA/YrhL
MGAMALYGFLFVCVACGNSFFGFFSSPAARVLGECSFGIYLLHGMALSVLFTEGASLLSPNFALLPILSCVVVLLTALTFLFIERPMIEVGSKLSKWRGGKLFLGAAGRELRVRSSIADWRQAAARD